jgi:hypothetical protein
MCDSWVWRQVFFYSIIFEDVGRDAEMIRDMMDAAKDESFIEGVVRLDY